MKFKIKSVIALTGLALLALAAPPAEAQVTATTSGNMISNVVVINHRSTNLTSSQYAVTTVRQKKDLAIHVQYYGLDATNTGTLGAHFDTYYGGTSSGVGTNITTTKPFRLTSTMNGVTVVRDSYVIPSTTLGPCTAIRLTTVTNEGIGANNIGSIILSNVVFEWSN